MQRGQSQTLSSGAQWKVKRQRAQTWEYLCEYQETMFYGEGDWVLALVAQGTCEVSTHGGTKKPPRHGPGQPGLVALLQQSGWTRRPSKATSKPQITPWFCENRMQVNQVIPLLVQSWTAKVFSKSGFVRNPVPQIDLMYSMSTSCSQKNIIPAEV